MQCPLYPGEGFEPSGSAAHSVGHRLYFAASAALYLRHGAAPAGGILWENENRPKQLERNEKRISELKRLFIKIYEDNAKGKLSDERFDMMSQTYEAEQKQLEAEVITLRKDLEVQQRQNENIEQFIQKAHKYVGIEELDPYALRELVKAIYVDAPVKINGKRTQHIHIQYDGIGFIPLDELLKEETA